MKDRLIGTWKLVSFEMRFTDGTLQYPWGADLSGQLTYTQEGYMSVLFMRNGRPAFAHPDIMAATPAECEMALKTLMAYAGTFECLADQVIHHAAYCTFPNWSGTAIARFVAFEDGRLTLSSSPIPYLGRQAAAVLVWQRG